MGGLDNGITILDRLPAEVLDSFTPDQRAALWQASKPMTWTRHPINIRLTTPGRRFFLTIVGGMEKRHPDRIARSRAFHPLSTLGNTLFLVGLGICVLAAAIVAMLIFSRLIDF